MVECRVICPICKGEATFYDKRMGVNRACFCDAGMLEVEIDEDDIQDLIDTMRDEGYTWE